jgi:hypothetical protein
MSWIGPAAKNGARLAVKYGPQAKIAWDKAGRPAADAAAKKAQSQLQRRKAFAKAALVVNGAVLKQMHEGEPVYVVLSEGDPVEAFPSVDIGLTALVRNADRRGIVTSKEFEAKRLKGRIERARRGGSDPSGTTRLY